MSIYPEYTGENVKYLYNRDISVPKIYNYSNISIPTPNYGSTISFKTRTTETITRDNYETVTPVGINTVFAEVNLQYNDIWNSEAIYLIHRINKSINSSSAQEEVVTLHNSGSEAGELDFESNYGTGLSIYRNALSGVLINDYSINTKENFLCDLSMSLTIDSYASFLDYRGIFTNLNYVENWETGNSFEKFDIVYYPLYKDKRNNFFYCKENHTSSTALYPMPESQYWTQSFFFEPDFAIQKNSDFSKYMTEKQKGFLEKIKLDKNSDKLNINLRFENRSNKETRALIHFLENKMGHRSFNMSLSGVYRSQKTFYAPSWSHSYVFYDVNSVEVDVKENIRNMAMRELNTSNFWNVI